LPERIATMWWMLDPLSEAGIRAVAAAELARPAEAMTLGERRRERRHDRSPERRADGLARRVDREPATSRPA